MSSIIGCVHSRELISSWQLVARYEWGKKMATGLRGWLSRFWRGVATSCCRLGMWMTGAGNATCSATHSINSLRFYWMDFAIAVPSFHAYPTLVLITTSKGCAAPSIQPAVICFIHEFSTFAYESSKSFGFTTITQHNCLVCWSWPEAADDPASTSGCTLPGAPGVTAHKCLAIMPPKWGQARPPCRLLWSIRCAFYDAESSPPLLHHLICHNLWNRTSWKPFLCSPLTAGEMREK